MVSAWQCGLRPGLLTCLLSVDLEALVGCVVGDIRPTARKHKLHVMNMNGRLVVQGDVIHLEQVLQNLILNATKYSPLGGEVSIQLGREIVRSHGGASLAKWIALAFAPCYNHGVITLSPTRRRQGAQHGIPP